MDDPKTQEAPEDAAEATTEETVAFDDGVDVDLDSDEVTPSPIEGVKTP